MTPQILGKILLSAFNIYDIAYFTTVRLTPNISTVNSMHDTNKSYSTLVLVDCMFVSPITNFVFRKHVFSFAHVSR